MKTKKPKKEKTLLGWREWVQLPNLTKFPIKAKIDTGARTSALHAHNIEIHKRLNHSWVTFELVPSIKMSKPIHVKAQLIEHRNVKSSSGHMEPRPVIKTTVKMGSEEFEIELTLVNRSLMGYRMLIGRRALKRRFYINPSRSFLLDKKRDRRVT
jgi:hypothetical protein